jgi:ABC-type dipeptide/oligopeptide/nickel transport system permease component
MRPIAMKLVLLDRLFSECRNLFLGLSLILRKHPFSNDFSTCFVVIHVCGSLANLIYSEHARAFGRESTDFTELVLPALTLSLFAVAPLARATRAAMLDVLLSDFVRTARAIPMSRAKVLFVYAFGRCCCPY